MEIQFPGFNGGGNELEAMYARLNSLPLKDPGQALARCFADGLKSLHEGELAALRARIGAHCGFDHTFVDIIDGHLALREMSAA